MSKQKKLNKDNDVEFRQKIVAMFEPLLKKEKEQEDLSSAEPYNVVVARKLKENGCYKFREIKASDGGRPLSFEDACRRYVNRFTKDHVPSWALKPINTEGTEFPAPQYRSDKEWYENTEFMGEGTTATRKYCRSMNQSWPCGKVLPRPYPEWAKMQVNARVRVSNNVSPPKRPKPKASPKAKK